MTTTDNRNNNPTVEAARLLANPGLANPAANLGATNYHVWMTNNGGYYELHWRASIIGSYDWVGLFANDSVPDSDYIGGNNWQKAKAGDSYTTSTPVQSQMDYEVRYLVWDAQAGRYVSVARGKLS